MLQPDILSALGRAGHGSCVLIADGNYPVSTQSPPGAVRVFLNLRPGMVQVGDVLEVLRDTVPIEQATLMATPDGQPAAIHQELLKLLPAGVHSEPAAGRILRRGEPANHGLGHCHRRGATFRQHSHHHRRRQKGPTMKALVLKDYMKFNYENTPTPEPGAGEVLVAVKACGICGSDVHGMDGSTGRRRPPVIMGHEAAGVIAEVGSTVNGWKQGDRVTFDSTIICGACAFCRRGRINLCENRRVLGDSCEDYRCRGAFAEYVVVPERVLYRLPDGLSFEHAAMVEPVSIAFHAVRRAPPVLNDTAVVVGAGMIGLFVIQALRLAGCGKIIAVDVVPDKLKLARELGASHTVNSGAEDVVARVQGLTGGFGAELAVEAVGLAQSVERAVRCMRKGGSVTLIGNVSPRVELPLQAVVTRELTLYGSCASSGEYPACLDMLVSGSVNVSPILSAVAPLAEGGSWFDRLYRKESGLLKVILTP
jgi:L-iditol 2-dehydrogenase